ncbi:MAG TPA: TIGR03564 family F420-dependent LLM class oxidoreductase [Acidimicrobiales bacterium]|nr:TIGR03564 family F420-dependent LLM class oxidoreductase [Acidimicrobiales bacterium]
MRIGLGLEMNGTIDDVVARAAALRSTGVASLWSSQIFGWDTVTALAVVGREVPEVALGTAVVPVHPRHPTMLAAQALTVQAATGGRFMLGIGLSHKVVVEGIWGFSYEHPARYMEEYLAILVPMLAGEQVSFQGEFLRASTLGPPETEGATPPPVLVAALGTVMLGVAARQASGTVTWMVGPETLDRHIVPTITAAADRAGRPAPMVVVTLPVCVTDDPETARHRAERIFSVYGHLPSYRSMLDREGVEGPADVAIVGDEGKVTAAIGRLADAGATEFSAAAYGSPEELQRTHALLGNLARVGGNG